MTIVDTAMQCYLIGFTVGAGAGAMAWVLSGVIGYMYRLVGRG